MTRPETEQATTPTHSTIEAMRAAEEQRKINAAERYREVLLRNDNPQPGDDVVLGECMAALGRAADDLAGDLKLASDIEAASTAILHRAKIHDLLKIETHRRAATESMIVEERRQAERGWAARVSIAAQAKAAILAEFSQLGALVDQLPVLRRKWAKVVDQQYHPERRPAHSSGADSAEAQAEKARLRVIGEAKSRLIDGGEGVDMKPDDAVSAVQSALRAGGYRKLSEDERKIFGIGDWPALACQVAADVKRADSD